MQKPERVIMVLAIAVLRIPIAVQVQYQWAGKAVLRQLATSQRMAERGFYSLTQPAKSFIPFSVCSPFHPPPFYLPHTE